MILPACRTQPRFSLIMEKLETCLHQKGNCPCLDARENEKEKLVPTKQHRLSEEQAKRFRLFTLFVTLLSIVSTTSLGIIAIALAANMKSSATLAFGLDAILDTLSSVVVLYRYTGHKGSIYSAKKEKIACTVIAILFIASSVTVGVRAGVALALHSVPTNNSSIWKIAIVNGTVSSILAMLKGYLGYFLESQTLLTDAYNSLIGGIMGYGSAISEFVFLANPNVWYLDGMFSFLCVGMLLIYGIWLLVYVSKTVPVEQDSTSNCTSKSPGQ